MGPAAREHEEQPTVWDAGVCDRSQCTVRYLPLGSPWPSPKVPHRAVTTAVRVGAGRWVVPGGWYRVGAGGCYTGTHPSMLHGSVLPGPNPCLDQRYLRPLGTPGPCRALRTPSSSHSPSGLHMARFSDINPKVSHNSRVSTKYVNEACHSPYIKNPVLKS